MSLTKINHIAYQYNSS